MAEAKRYSRSVGRSRVKRPAAKAPRFIACPCCEIEFRQKRKTQRACNRACYLALWHFEELEKVVRAGRADGLRDVIRELYALLAERKLGEMLRETERARGALKRGPVVPQEDHGEPTLSELGLTKRESSEAQILAQLPEKEFEEVKEGRKSKVEARR